MVFPAFFIPHCDSPHSPGPIPSFPMLCHTDSPSSIPHCPSPPFKVPMAISLAPLSALWKTLACQCSIQLLHCPVIKPCLPVIVHSLAGCHGNNILLQTTKRRCFPFCKASLPSVFQQKNVSAASHLVLGKEQSAQKLFEHCSSMWKVVMHA